jgi:hypothetical protein
MSEEMDQVAVATPAPTEEMEVQIDPAIQQEIVDFISDHATVMGSLALIEEIHQDLATVDGMTVALEVMHENIALEGIGETLKGYWQKFLAFVKKIWEKIVAFFERHFTVLGRRRQHIEQLLKSVKAIGSNPGVYQKLGNNEPPIVVSKAATEYFMFDHLPCEDYSGLLAGLEGTQAAVKMITQDYAQFVVGRAALIDKGIRAAKADNAQGILVHVTQELTQNPFHAKGELMGNVAVSYGEAQEGSHEENNLDTLRLMLTQRQKAPSTIEFTPMKIQEMVQIFGVMNNILDILDTFKNGEYKTIVSNAKVMLNNTDQFVKNVSGLSVSDAIDAGERAVGHLKTYQDIMALNKHYLNWIKAPTMEAIRYVTNAFFFIGMEMDQNVSLYHADGAINIFTVMGGAFK